MFARKLRPDEFWRAELNMAVAFESEFDWKKEREKLAQTDPLADLYGAFLQEGEPPAASLVMNKKQVRFDGHILKMGGVGGVATLPSYRRGGAIRACMEASLRDLYDGGYALSHLYPFSTAYYRQFGYAPASQTLRWTVNLEDLKRLPQAGGSVRQLLPGDDLSPLLDVYNQMYGDTNFSCLRNVFDKELTEKDPLTQKRWTFLWSDSSGVPGGFLVCARKGEALHCVPEFAMKNALLFTNAQALTGLLNFVHHAFLANFREIHFVVPSHIDLTALLPELSDINYKPVLNGMARAVNAETLLRLCKCRGQGRLNIQTTDPILSENNATFSLSFMPGEENQVERTAAEPDVTLDVGNLAVLLGGARDTSSIAMTPDIVVHTPAADLDQVFYRKPCHILDLF
ncbi:GNAT family N-acetyltransferase [Acutalibacter sp. 1XD8-33]|uniref:GNAT family N-acetyltransferase n=1 Tax=Acutalibacter sp. 1XD8-33 TaxID=2320081 RepID=UPI000EA3A322|nr:GNAT family N-acetyltransferase [Acutalibacter sp. 1XD8-33]RKJ39948.1 GNAT family N-acetyltransferase [Acutalibacter sp. 1XD8-33]